MTSASSSNSLGVYMGYLRRKTEVGDEPRLLHTVRGVGYVLRTRAMSFRRRITLVSAAAVAIAVVLASLLIYVLTSDQLHSQVDTQLRDARARDARLERLFAVGAAGRPGRPPARVSAPGACDRRQELRATSPRRCAGERAGSAASAPGSRAGSLFGKLPPDPDQVRGYQQVVDANGKVLAALRART